MKDAQFIKPKNAILTVITLTYNSSQYLEKCLISLHRACRKLQELSIDYSVSHLVIDGYSNDNTQEIIKTISPFSEILMREKNGLYDAMNYGISLVKSPYVMYLHSDDEIDELFLLEMFKKIQKFSNYEHLILYGTVDFIDDKSQLLFSRRPPFYVHNFQKKVSLIFHPNAIYSTNLEQKYPYNNHDGLAADHKHITKIAQKAKLIRIPSAKYRFRMSELSSTMNKINVDDASKINNYSWPRLYIRLFETKLMKRFLMKFIQRKSYWKLSN